MDTLAVILASDEGLGMKSEKPKALAEVLFKPMLDWVLSAVKKSGIEDICVVTGFGSEMIREHLSEDIVTVCLNEKKGSFYELMAAEPFIKTQDATDILVLFGDTPFVDAETITDALHFHDESKNDVTFLSSDEDGEAGAFCFSKNALLDLMHRDGSDMLSIFKAAEGLPNGVYCTDNENAFLSAYTKRQLNELNALARNEILENLMDGGVDIPCRDGIIIGTDCVIGSDTLVLPGTIMRGAVTVGKNCVIGPNSYVEDAEIGDHVQFNNGQIRRAKILNDANIGPFVQIRPDSVIGNGVHLGNFVEVKNSVIDASTSVSHLTYVGDSDVGKNVNFGCGVVTVNFNGKTKNRTVIKDRAFIGCNTNLVAPVTVGENSYTAAGSTVTEDVPDNTLAIARERQTNKEGWVKEKQPYRKKV